jgi:hypothetical protein
MHSCGTPSVTWTLSEIIVKKLFSLNTSVMDDNYDTSKTANIEIIKLLVVIERLIKYLSFRTSYYL